MRAFIAVELTEEIQRRYSALYEAGKRRYPRLRWVSPENLHVTLRFLGDTGDDAVTALREDLSPLSTPVFEASLGGPGSFGPRPSPRTLWLGIGAGRAQFEELAETAERAARNAGFPPERRPWRGGHVTIARNPRQVRVPEWSTLSQGCGLENASFPVTHMTLLESELQPAGPIYSVMWRLPLNGRS